MRYNAGMKEQERYVALRILKTTHGKLQVLAALRGMSMLATIDELTDDEIAETGINVAELRKAVQDAKDN